MLVSELTEKTAEEKKEGRKERRVTSVEGGGSSGSRHADSTQRSVARHDGISGRDILVEIK